LTVSFPLIIIIIIIIIIIFKTICIVRGRRTIDAQTRSSLKLQEPNSLTAPSPPPGSVLKSTSNASILLNQDILLVGRQYEMLNVRKKFNWIDLLLY